LLEIAGFVVVGSHVGVLATIGLVLLSGVLGLVLLRWQGFGTLARMRTSMDEGRDPGPEVAHTMMIAVAAVLLIVPGFVSDIVGLLLFVPFVREFVWKRARASVRTEFVMRDGFARSRSRGRTIDLDEDEFTSRPNPSSPWRGIDRDP